VTFCNRSGREHFGLRDSDIVGAKLEPLIYPTSLTGRVLTTLLGSGTTGGEVLHETVCLANSAGNRTWTSWTFRASSDTHGNAIGVLGIGTDVTELKEEEERSKRLEQLAVETQKLESIATLGGGIAHGFNNVLQRIYGYAGLLRVDEALSPTSREYVEHVVAGTRDATRLTELLLGFARGGRYLSKTVDPSVLVSGTIQLLTPQTKGVRVHESYAEGKGTINADSAQIEQVIANLHSNALNAMPDGGDLHIETTYHTVTAADPERGLAPGLFVRIRVKDSGVGMDDDVRKRIFEPFFSTRPMGPATQGLGLAATHGIVTNHGGNIVVESAPGQGTTFDLYLPATAHEPPPTAKPQRPARLEGHETLLVVDDEELVTTALCRVLRHYGYNVLTATSGPQGVALCAREQDNIDLIILDMVMPGMDGTGTYRALRDAGSKVRVLISSGNPMGNDTAALIDAGCVGFLQKPYSAEVLIQHIRSALVA
jgi:PAS domain S-box-containing protein